MELNIDKLEGFCHKGQPAAIGKVLIVLTEQFDTVLEDAEKEMSPSVIASYAFQLAQQFNSFYAEKVEGKYTYSVREAESPEKTKVTYAIGDVDCEDD